MMTSLWNCIKVCNKNAPADNSVGVLSYRDIIDRA